MKADDTMMKAEMHNSVQRQHHAEPLAQKNVRRVNYVNYVNHVNYANYVNYVHYVHYVNYVELC